MSEIFTDQLTAVANVVLAVFAIVTAVLAGAAFRKQSREVRAIERQLDIQREDFDTRRAEARQAQATRVFLWREIRPAEGFPQPTGTFTPSQVVVTAHIRNASDLPIFSVEIGANHYVDEQVNELWGEPERIEILLPGETRDFPRTRDIPDQYVWVDYLVGDPVLIASFRDNAGTRWIVGSQGTLRED